MRPIAPDRLQYRFPNIIKVCRTWGCDPLTQPVPVAPAAHYWMGGITTDIHSQTTIPRLFAVGENASTGVHGANRLASNSLLECLVYGAELEHLDLIPGLVQDSGAPSDRSANPGPEDILKVAGDLLEMAELSQQREELNQLMWDYAAISRTQSGLEKAIATLNSRQQTWQRDAFLHALAAMTPGQSLALPKNLDFHWVRALGRIAQPLRHCLADPQLRRLTYRESGRALSRRSPPTLIPSGGYIPWSRGNIGKSLNR